MQEKTILKNIRHADATYNLINDGDKILVGVSGGKDSLALLYCLKKYQNIIRDSFEIVPAIIDLGFPTFNALPIKEYVKSLGMDLKVIDGKDVYQILKVHQKEKDEKQLSCSICSRMKKALMNKVAHELGCNKVAFAHHIDDAIETFYLNTTFGGKIGTFAPKMFLERSKITFIRPFILVRENDIIELVKEIKIPVFSSGCPNDKKTMREFVKQELNHIYELYPTARKNYYRMLFESDKQDLWNKEVYLKVLGSKNLSLKKVADVNDAHLEDYLRLKIYVKQLKEDINLEFKNEINDINRYIIYEERTPIGIVSYREKKDSFIIKLGIDKSSLKDEIDLEIIDFIEYKLRRLNSHKTIDIYYDKKRADILSTHSYARARNNKVISKLTKFQKDFRLKNY